MKFFAAGLLFANIVFAVWYSAKNHDVTPVARHDKGVEMLVLVNESEVVNSRVDTAVTNESEVVSSRVDTAVTEDKSDTELKDDAPLESEKQEESRSDTKPQSFSADTAPSGDNCYIMSLFDSRTYAQSAATELLQKGYQVRVDIRYSSKVKYLVYLPAFDTVQDARKITLELEEMGQRDFQILSIKGERNSISLGVYSQPHTAAIRQKQIESLGYSPLVEPVYGTPMGYQLEFNKPDISLLTSQEKRDLIETFKNMTIRPQKCGS